MSLINDALKKAQNRHGDSTPPTGPAGPAAIPANPRKGKSPMGKIVLIGIGIALLSAAVSTTVILLVVHKDEPAPPPVSSASPPAPPSPRPPPERSVQPVATTTPAPSAIPPVTPAVVEKIVLPDPVTPTFSLPPSEPVAPAIKLGTRIQSFIDRLRVTSIRISDTGNKVILNDRLFRENDLVEPSLGLRLTEIQAGQLIFTDEASNIYLRRF